MSECSVWLNCLKTGADERETSRHRPLTKRCKLNVQTEFRYRLTAYGKKKAQSRPTYTYLRHNVCLMTQETLRIRYYHITTLCFFVCARIENRWRVTMWEYKSEWHNGKQNKYSFLFAASDLEIAATARIYQKKVESCLSQRRAQEPTKIYFYLFSR